MWREPVKYIQDSPRLAVTSLLCEAIRVGVLNLSQFEADIQAEAQGSPMAMQREPHSKFSGNCIIRVSQWS
jgi:hypothetical protein